MAENEKSKAEELKEKLVYKKPDIFEKLGAEGMAKCSEYAAGYMKFIDAAKTEREAVKYGIMLAKERGFVEHKLGEKVAPGGKYYYNNRGKQLFVFTVGSEPESGIIISAAHVDSPRIDLKPMPLYEDSGFAFFKTHYYGGVKKYQWTAIPLAIHGVVSLPNGETVEVTVGEDEGDPVFYITDLLPHLAKDQYEKKLSEAFQGENMNVLLGSEPIGNKDDKDRVKKNILKLLNEKYGIVEEDLVSSELQVVPSFKARDVGIDRSMIGAYGNDDRVCAYPALMALMETKEPEYTAICYLTDKEEIGSVGNTGAESRALENFIAELCLRTTEKQYSDLLVRMALDRSKMLSADVNAALDPNYEGTHDKMNAGYLGKGIAILKYSGSRGKAGASDASAEYLGEIRRLFNEHNIPWHITELGAVDKGGGGTIAMMIANLGVDVIDVGVPVLSMHAPFEIISKIDLYAVYRGYRVFFE